MRAARNDLAHRFLRDRALFMGDPEFCEEVGEELVKILNHLDAFEECLAVYKRDIGVPELTDEEAAELGLAEPPDRSRWFEADGEGDR